MHTIKCNRIKSCKGYKIDEAIRNAKDYISGALADGMDLGHGSGPMNHGFDLKSRFAEL